MAKWYLTPQNKRFDGWHPSAMAREASANVSLTSIEPTGPIDLGASRLVPLTDNPPVGKIVTGTSVTVSDDYAEVVYQTQEIPREDQKATAIQEVDSRHQEFLIAMTGNATEAERATWAPKEAAARAHQAGSASAAQTLMLSTEASDRGITVAQHVATIVARADQYFALIGVAGGIHAKGRALIEAACADAVPSDQVAAQISTALQQMDAMIAAAKNA